MIKYVNAFLAPYNPKRIYFSMDYTTEDEAKKAIILNQDRYIGTYPIDVDSVQYEITLQKIKQSEK